MLILDDFLLAPNDRHRTSRLYEEEISSPSVTWKVPAVMRLRRAARGAWRGIKFSRTNVYARDGYRCQYCRGRSPVAQLSYERVVPRAAGGCTDWMNIVTAFRECNTRKGSRMCDESGMWPVRAPVRPNVLNVTGPTIERATAPEEWLAFVREFA